MGQFGVHSDGADRSDDVGRSCPDKAPTKLPSFGEVLFPDPLHD